MNVAGRDFRVMHVITGLGRGGAESQLVALLRAGAPGMGRAVVVSLLPGGSHRPCRPSRSDERPCEVPHRPRQGQSRGGVAHRSRYRCARSRLPRRCGTFADGRRYDRLEIRSAKAFPTSSPRGWRLVFRPSSPMLEISRALSALRDESCRRAIPLPSPRPSAHCSANRKSPGPHEGSRRAAGSITVSRSRTRSMPTARSIPP